MMFLINKITQNKAHKKYSYSQNDFRFLVSRIWVQKSYRAITSFSE
ncbi:hypothetical protein RO950_12195 [Staphylococcus haemolyticus]|uniref:Uncharacterized protein n=1 Tax=Staphylococcus haemolyticus TaxID=1283 RepID=A0ABU3IJP4_STAHA|nr:hypothetical protein [Staphylococcus haemolyticus]MDT4255901.1 hypothetical protein [Staphylococcus haemolyticus]MDT4287727.1 hypothetical protein [Staphylococcus haemolyticus]